MAGKTINVTLDAKSLKNAAKEIRKYQQSLQKKISVFLDRLAQEGYEVARVGFETGNYQYDGRLGEVSVHTPEKRGEYARAIVATGETVLFIEFGTGAHYKEKHPEEQQTGMTRGSYSKGGKARNWWEYYGEPGTNGWPVGHSRKRGENLIRTDGNPANMPMYNAKVKIEEKFAEIAREVFGPNG